MLRVLGVIGTSQLPGERNVVDTIRVPPLGFKKLGMLSHIALPPLPLFPRWCPLVSAVSVVAGARVEILAHPGKGSLCVVESRGQGAWSCGLMRVAGFQKHC